MSNRAQYPLLGGLLAVAVLLGWSIGSAKAAPVIAVLGVIGIAAVSRFRTSGILIVLLSVSSVVAVYAWPRIGLFGDAVYLSEVLLAVAVIASMPAFAELVRSGRARMDWIAWVLAGLFVVNCFGVLIGLSRGAGIGAAIAGFRPMLYLWTFIPARVAVEIFPSRRSMATVLLVVSAVVSLVAIVQFVIGPQTLLFVIGSFDALVRTDPETGFFRVRPPGLYLVYAATIISIARLIWGGPGHLRRLALICLPLGFTCIGLSLNRNMAVGVLLGLAVSFIAVKRRSHMVVAAIGTMVTVVFVFGALSTLQVDERLVGRFTSVLSGEARSAALSDRAYETEFALNAVMRSPLVGIGWGTGYGALATRSVGGAVSSFERPWLHNQYLAQWMRTGILGFLLIVGLTVGAIVSAFRNTRVDQHDEWIELGVLAALVAFALSSLVDIVWANPNNLAVLMFLVAMVSAANQTRHAALSQDAGTDGGAP